MTLGRAMFAAGKKDEGRQMLLSAVDQLQNALGPDHPDTQKARRLATPDIEGQR